MALVFTKNQTSDMLSVYSEFHPRSVTISSLESDASEQMLFPRSGLSFSISSSRRPAVSGTMPRQAGK
jgi:hypothetical protein